MRTEPWWSDWVSVTHHKSSFIGIHRGVPTRAENKHQGRAKESALPVVTVSTDVADKAAFVKRGCGVVGGVDAPGLDDSETWCHIIWHYEATLCASHSMVADVI